jgi:hypothetical protein
MVMQASLSFPKMRSAGTVSLRGSADGFPHSGGQEINRILERLVVSCVSCMPSVKCMGQASGLIIRKAMRDDEHTRVGMSSMIKVDGQFDEIIAIARDKEPVFGSRIVQLGFVSVPAPLDLVDTHDIKPQTTTNLRHGGVDILVQ